MERVSGILYPIMLEQRPTSFPRADMRRTEMELQVTPAMKRLRSVLDALLEKPSPETFTHVSPETIVKDTETATELRKKFEGTKSPMGELGEDLMLALMREGEWLGSAKEVFIHEASDFDDLTRGVDAVVEWKINDKTSIFAAIDFTVARAQAAMETKLPQEPSRWKDMADVRYVRSAFFPDEERELERVPRFVVGMDMGVDNSGLESATKTYVTEPTAWKKPSFSAKGSERSVWRWIALEQISTQAMTTIQKRWAELQPQLEAAEVPTVLILRAENDLVSFLLGDGRALFQQMQEAGADTQCFVELLRLCWMCQSLKTQQNLMTHMVPNIRAQGERLIKGSDVYRHFCRANAQEAR